jgi:hypothetical protein
VPVTCRRGKRVRGDRAKSRPTLPPDALKGRSPREHPAVGVLIPRPAARDSREGQSPETAASRAGLPLRRGVYREEQRYVGPPRRKRAGHLSGGEGSEGRIPRALPARNKAGKVPEGVSRQEGSQTLKPERCGQATPASCGSPVPQVLWGPEAQERGLRAAARGLGVAGQNSRGTRKAQRGWRWLLNCGRRGARLRRPHSRGKC